MDATLAEVLPAQARKRMGRVRSGQRQRLLLQPAEDRPGLPAEGGWREPRSSGSSRALLIAVALSLLLHALGVMALSGFAPAPAPSPPVALLWVAAASSEPEAAAHAAATPAPSPPPAPARRERRPERRAPVSRATPEPDAAQTEPVAALPSASDAAPEPSPPLPAGDAVAAAGAINAAAAGAGPSASAHAAVRRVRGGYQQRPAYPARALRLGLEGTTLLRVRVTADGRVRETVVERSAGEEEFDRSASEAVRRWRFEATREGDPPDDVWVLVPIQFEIRERIR